MTSRSWITLLVSLALVGLTVAYLGLRLLGPSDGAWLDPARPAVVDGALVVQPLRPGALEPGDRVTAIEGQSLESWARLLLSREVARPAWEPGRTVQVEVVRDGQPRTLQVRLGPFPAQAILRRSWGLVLFSLGSLVVGGFVFLRRPDDPAARALLLWGTGVFTGLGWAFGLEAGDLVRALPYWLREAGVGVGFILIWTAGLHLALVFPRPWPPVVRRPWLIAAVYLPPYLAWAAELLLAWPQAPSPLARAVGPGWGDLLAATAYSVLILGRLVYVYRARLEPVARQQVRWVVWAAVVAVSTEIVGGIIPENLGRERLVSVNAMGLSGLVVPLALAVAILRYRLFEIDVVIRRSLIYGSLTAVLAGLYFGAVVLLQGLFRSVTGTTSDLAIVLSTLTMAGLAQPLRGRIQTLIDRRFYRRKYDAARALEAFAAGLRDEVDLTELEGRLVGVVQETVQPAGAWLWLRRA